MATTDLAELERRLWAAADELRANSTLTAAQYRDPVLGLIFLAFAEHRFEQLRPELEAKATEIASEIALEALSSPPGSMTDHYVERLLDHSDSLITATP